MPCHSTYLAFAYLIGFLICPSCTSTPKEEPSDNHNKQTSVSLASETKETARIDRRGSLIPLEEKQKKNIVYITFNHEIKTDNNAVNAAIDLTEEIIRKHAPETIYYLLNSPGGDTKQGFVLYNYLRGLPQRIVTHNVGSCDSAMSIVFLAGSERFATPASSFLLHGPTATINWDKMPLDKIKEQVSFIEVMSRNMEQIMIERTFLTSGEVKALFQQGEYKLPQFAKEKGLIHDIKLVNMQKNCPSYLVK